MNQLHILYLVSLLMDLSVAGFIFAVGRRAAEHGVSAGALGLLNSAMVLPYAVMALVAGHFSDRFGRRRVALASQLLICLVPAAGAWITNVPLLILLCVVMGIGLGGFWPAIIGWIGEGANGAVLHRRLTSFAVFWNIGLLLGFWLTGLLFERWLPLAFYFSAVAALLAGLLLIVPARAALAASNPAATATAALPPKGRGFRKTAWLANFAVQLANNGMAAIFPQLATSLGIHAGLHGSLLAAERAASLVMVIGLQVLTFWRIRLWPLWVTQLVGAAGILLVAWGDKVGLFVVAFVVVGLVRGYSYQASIFFTLDEMSEKGKGGGFHEAALGAGLFAGPVLAGWVGNHTSLRAPYLFCAAALVVLVGAQILITAHTRPSAKRV